jgi:hypothetical protein
LIRESTRLKFMVVFTSTLEQAQRLCGVERALCQQELDTLVESNFLNLKTDGAYARVTVGADHAHPHPQAAKADLRTSKRAQTAS